MAPPEQHPDPPAEEGNPPPPEVQVVPVQESDGWKPIDLGPNEIHAGWGGPSKKLKGTTDG